MLPIVEVCNSRGQWRGLTISGLSIQTVSLNLVFFPLVALVSNY